MSQDRAQVDSRKLTHEFLAMMLGVRRPGVTLALGTLARQGLVRSDRGLVTILDRDGLKAMCGGIYGAAEAEHCRLFPSADARR